ncbi:MAG: transposase [Rhodoferax sp.]|nr:transposase [Rhodoferax sp.]MDD4941944.1 transposase [Rhodoferax sp.]MDD5480021.1 transposase [Rhodoferax sp.]
MAVPFGNNTLFLTCANSSGTHSARVLANLIGRLRDYSNDVWRFMTQPDVPFTNNLAEQTVRMPKVKQKVSGCFRTPLGATNYCVIRSYCATMHKQWVNIFDSLAAAFKGSPLQPCFA